MVFSRTNRIWELNKVEKLGSLYIMQLAVFGRTVALSGWNEPPTQYKNPFNGVPRRWSNNPCLNSWKYKGKLVAFTVIPSAEQEWFWKNNPFLLQGSRSPGCAAKGRGMKKAVAEAAVGHRGTARALSWRGGSQKESEQERSKFRLGFLKVILPTGFETEAEEIVTVTPNGDGDAQVKR